jgi:hypothetical protein
VVGLGGDAGVIGDGTGLIDGIGVEFKTTSASINSHCAADPESTHQG